MEILAAKKIIGEIADIPSDKSISHRCAIFSLLANRPSEIKNFLFAQDTLHSLEIAKQLGLGVIHQDEKTLQLIPPKNGIKEPRGVLDCGNAGTAMRLYAGLLCGVQGNFVLDGDCYLRVRPMQRIIKPLREMGARIFARSEDNFAPISIKGGELRGVQYVSNIASAQIKSAVILAGLHAKEQSMFKEPSLSRDHTETMLKAMGATLDICDDGILIHPLKIALEPLYLQIPSDPSSAFFFALAAVILPNSHLVLKNVLLNPTRIAAFKVLQEMGAKISYTITQRDFEVLGDIEVQSSSLHAVSVERDIAWLIDEIPALSIAMALAQGKSYVHHAKELRTKECDRIMALVSNLRAMGIEIEEFEDGFSIQGGSLQRAKVKSFGDHRIAMSFAIAGLVCGVEIEDFGCVGISFPNFLEILQRVVSV